MSPKKKDLGVNEIFLFPKMKELLMEFSGFCIHLRKKFTFIFISFKLGMVYENMFICISLRADKLVFECV